MPTQRRRLHADRARRHPGLPARDSQSIGTWPQAPGRRGARTSRPLWGINFGIYSFNSAAPFPQLLELPRRRGRGHAGWRQRHGARGRQHRPARRDDAGPRATAACGGGGRQRPRGGRAVAADWSGGCARRARAAGVNGGMLEGLRGDTTVTARQRGVASGCWAMAIACKRPAPARPLLPLCQPLQRRGQLHAGRRRGCACARWATSAVNTFTDPGGDTPVSETAGTNADGITGFDRPRLTLWTPATQIDPGVGRRQSHAHRQERQRRCPRCCARRRWAAASATRPEAARCC